MNCAEILLKKNCSRNVLECLWDSFRTLYGTIFCSTSVLAKVIRFLVEKF